MPDNRPRQWQLQGVKPFRLEVLTPVFIGSGATLSPLEYVLREERGQYRLYRIDLASWMMENAADQNVQSIVASGDIARIRRMLDEKVDAAVYAVSSSPLEDATLARDLRQAFAEPSDSRGPQQSKRLAAPSDSRGPAQKSKTGEIDAALRNPLDNGLYIPGSSLKGAISTPLINWLDKQSLTSLNEHTQTDPKQGLQRGLKAMFGAISEHAMQALKVSDVPAPLDACAVVRAKERSRNPAKQGTAKPPCEAIMPGYGDMWGRLMLDSASGVPAIRLPKGKVIPFDELVRLCNAFYRKRFDDELTKFYQLPHFSDVRSALREVQARVAGLDNSAMLLRVGHYCHVECVTVDKNKPFTRSGKYGTPLPFGTTRTLAGGSLPFGWIILHFCPLDAYAQGLEQVERERHAAVAAQSAQRLNLRREAEAKAAQAAELASQRDAQRRAAEQRAAAEQQNKAELTRRMAELSPEEARLLELHVAPSEALSMALFAEMKTWSPELQRKAAVALQQYWMSLGKWDGKQSKKQEGKIREIKALLG